MDTFFTSAKQADSVKLVDFASFHHALSTLQTTEEARDLLSTLIDAYDTADSSHVVYHSALLKAIGSFLRCAGSLPDDVDSVNLWKLSADDYILLALFFNELSTLEDVHLFTCFTEAVTLFFQQTAPLVYGDTSYNSSVEMSALDSLRGELQTLRVMMEKRLTTSPVESHISQSCTVMQMGIIDSLRALLLSLMHLTSESIVEGTPEAKLSDKQREDLTLAVRQVVEGVLHPLTTAVKVLGSTAARGNNEKTPMALRSHYAAAVSPLVLSSALHVLEELLWCCAVNVTSQGSFVDTTTDTPLVSAGRFVANRVLSLLQQYLVLQQQQSIDSAAGSIGKGWGVVDLLRTAGAQHAVRRLLSVARLNIALFPSMENALVAALNAFGGKVDIENPFQLMRLRHECIVASMDNHEAAMREGWEAAETMLSSPSSRLRECQQILEAPHEETVANDATAADLGELDDATLLHSGGGGVGGKEALLQSSVGPVSVTALLDMVLLSIRHMDIMTEQTIQALHLQGLEQMQNDAAKKAQREEIQRLRRIEQQGVENIPVGRLLENLKESTALYAKGTQFLDSESSLAMMLRSAFFSLLDAYDLVAQETENRVREAQALIARALGQLPLSMIDAALDAICVCFRKELLQCAHAKTTPLPLNSVYQLVMQVLFTLFSAQAPVLERGTTAFSFLSTANIVAGGELQHQGSPMELQSNTNFTIDTDNPVEWLQSTTQHDTVGTFGDRKRPREERIGGGINDYENRDALVDGSSCFFREDNIQTPCVYSHFLCRVMELVTEAEMPALFLDVLLHCPRITRYAWHYIHKQYCLSAEKARCLLGMWLLKGLALKRAVYRRYAVNSLLYLAAARSEYPRRLALTQLGVLLSASGADGRRVIDTNAEALLVRYAKRQMAAIPVTKLTSFTVAEGATNRITKLENATAGSNNNNDDDNDNDAIAAASSLREKEMQRLVEKLDQQLGPFLMLCAQQPKELFPALLAVFKECVQRHNKVMMHLLAEHVDIHRMCRLLFRNDAFSFMANVMPYLRRHSGDATVLVQKILWVISAELRLMAEASEPSAADCERIAMAFLGHAQVMYDGSEVPLLYRFSSGDAASVGAGDSTVALHDVRFIAPFFSLTTARELKQVHLRSFLCFVQLQLFQQKRQQQQALATGMTADAEVLGMNGEELHRFIRDVVREVLVRSPVAFTDGKSRGLSRTELLVYLHRAPHESHATDTQTSSGKHSMSLLGAAHDESRGILDVASSSSTATATTAENTPISPLTTKEVIGVLLRLTRTFDDTTTELLYGPEEIKSAVRQMMQYPGSRGAPTVPSQLMATLILACSIHTQRSHGDLVRFIHQTVLLPLVRENMWEKDPQLWRGVLLFAEMHYRACSSFLVNLPDQVLIQALHARPQLREYFKEEHGNNASFGHVLGSL